jgi:hypothetical protein
MTNLNQSTAAPALDEQDRPDQESAVRISLIEVSDYCRSSDLPEILGEVDRELQMARLGQGRWKEMKLDLMYGDAFSVHPIDYCVEISSEGAAFLKENEGIDLNRLLFSAALHAFAKMLDLHGFDLTREFTLEDVLLVLDGFEDRIRSLTRIRGALGRAMAAEYCAAQQAKVNEPQTETPPVSPKPKKAGFRKKR